MAIPPSVLEPPVTACFRKSARVGALFALGIYLLVGMKLVAAVLLGENEEGAQSGLALLPKLVDGLIVLMGIAGLALAPSTKRKWRVIALVAALLTMAAASQLIAGRALAEVWLTLAKFIAPLLVLSACLLNQNATGGAASARAIVWWVVALAVAGLAFVEPSFRNGQEWLPAYFSGAHTSAYVGIFTVCIAVTVRDREWWRLFPALPVVALLYMVVLGWGVRTAIFSAAIAIAYIVFKRASSNHKLLLASLGSLAILSLGVFALASGHVTSASLEEFSSGRTSVWLSRLGQIGSRSPVEWLLGTGIGSNVTYSEVWWWELKDSHNDFLAVAYEQGAVGLGLTLMFMLSVYRLGPRSMAWNAVWLMYLVCSVLSNGLMFRPTAAYVFVLAALAAYRSAPGMRR